MPESTILSVDELVKHFGPIKAVDSITFAIQKGEMVGFIGPNGAGKTTTYRSIVGLQSPDSGRVVINGFDIQKERVQALRQIGYVGQDLQLFDYLTGEELLRLVGDLYELSPQTLDHRLQHLAEILGLEQALKRLVKHYSGGMARKLGIATALIAQPPLLLLDESFAGLDPESTAAIRQHLNELRQQGTAVLLTSHVLDLLERWVSRLIIVHSGRVIKDLSRAELDDLLGEQYDSLTSVYLEAVGK